MFRNQDSGTWYDPRAPMVGKYARGGAFGFKGPAKTLVRSPSHTMFIGNK